jgi:hypothetical protein
MATLKITYSAEGRYQGSKVDLRRFCGKVYDDFTIDSSRWQQADTPREQERILLGVARREYPEADWEHASVVEIKQM